MMCLNILLIRYLKILLYRIKDGEEIRIDGVLTAESEIILFNTKSLSINEEKGR